MSFADIIGHAPVVELLRQAVRRGRVPQSLILAGPEGVGKRAVAMALAQAVNCPKQADGDACGTCNVCTRIARNRFPDVTWLERGDQASIKIQPLREQILDAVGYRPFEGARRVFLIDDADDLTTQAQDALLKTLEEPPPSAILVLITAYPDTLLATIQSRCRRLRFGRLAEADVARVLVTRAGLDPVAARRLAVVSGGSVSRALSEETGHFEEDRDAAMGLLRARGTAMPGRMKAAAAFAQHDTKRRAREAASTRLAILASLVRDLGALSASGAVPLANADLDEELRRMAPTFEPPHLIEAFSAIDRASHALDCNASPKVVADWLAVMISPLAAGGRTCDRAPGAYSFGVSVPLPRIAITVGDPSGIGPEIALKAAADPRVIAVCDPVIYGPTSAGELATFTAGRVDAASGRAAYELIVRAVDDAKAGRVAGIATAPISKAAFARAGLEWPGHTDLLAHLCGLRARDVAMMFWSDTLRVVLATVHIPLARVPGAITIELLRDTIALTARSLPSFGIPAPRIALAGLNPHAGEDGLLGTEDAAVIAPAVQQARATGVDVSGPHPADTLFVRAARGEFDVVIAMYHDQGLVPVKLAAFGTSVNVTIGLPIIRTSVDHGTAFDIARKGMADHGSMVEAVLLAARLAARS